MAAERDPGQVDPVVFIVPDLHKEARGVAPAVVGLASELARQGATILVHTLEPTPQPHPRLAAEVDLHLYRRSRLLWRLG